MSLDQQERLLGLIYDAVFDPPLIVPAMEELAAQLSGETACVTTLDIVTGEGGGYTALVPDGTMDTYVAHWARDNPLHEVGDPIAYVANWRPDVLRYEEWVDPDELRRSGYYNDFLRPIGSENGIMIGLAMTGTTTTTMNVARSLRRGPFSDEEIARARRWQAHLARAERMARKVRIGQASLDAVDRLLETTPHPLFFLDARGRVRRVSRSAEAMLAAGSPIRLDHDLLAAASPNDDAALQRLIAAATGRDRKPRQGGAVVLSDLSGCHEVAVAPLGPRGAAAWSTEPVAMVTLTAGEAPRLPSDLALRRRYRLTPAEARLALALAKGGTLREAADEAAVSINTVRAQLGAVFSKTGCHRQADLVRTVVAMDRAKERAAERPMPSLGSVCPGGAPVGIKDHAPRET